MADQSPESIKGPPPTQGSGQYIAVAAILLIFIGGVVAYKVSQSAPEETTNVAPSASVKKTAAPAFTDTLPPIPTDEPTASVSASASAKAPVAGGGGGGGCSAECAGQASARVLERVPVRRAEPLAAVSNRRSRRTKTRAAK
ncbi:MAG: hypothetical protein U0165_14935 [Polyangiaceae bacterium]